VLATSRLQPSLHDLELLVALGALPYVVRKLLAELRVVDAAVEERGEVLEESVAIEQFLVVLVASRPPPPPDPRDAG
jgi:hypothetical protein